MTPTFFCFFFVSAVLGISKINYGFLSSEFPSAAYPLKRLPMYIWQEKKRKYRQKMNRRKKQKIEKKKAEAAATTTMTTTRTIAPPTTTTTTTVRTY